LVKTKLENQLGRKAKAVYQIAWPSDRYLSNGRQARSSNRKRGSCSVSAGAWWSGARDIPRL